MPGNLNFLIRVCLILIFSLLFLNLAYTGQSYFWDSYINFRTSHRFFKEKNIANLYSFQKIQKNKNSVTLFYENEVNSRFLSIHSKSYLDFQNIFFHTQGYKNELNLYIKELYASSSWKSFSLSIGRKEIQNHFSFIHKILNIFSEDLNNNDNISEIHLIPGKNLVNIQYNSGHFSSNFSYINSHLPWEKIDSGYDLEGKGSSYYAYVNNFSILSSKTDFLTLYSYKIEHSEHILGLGIGQLISDSAILYSEFKSHFSSEDLHPYHSKNVHEFIFGGQYTFKNNVDFYLEYYFNGWGYLNSDWGEIRKGLAQSSLEERQKFLPLLYPRTYKIRRHYLSLMLKNVRIFNLAFHFLPTLSLEDLSLRFITGAKKNLNDKVQFIFRNSLYLNNNFSNFGLVPFVTEFNFNIKYFF